MVNTSHLGVFGGCWYSCRTAKWNLLLWYVRFPIRKPLHSWKSEAWWTHDSCFGSFNWEHKFFLNLWVKLRDQSPTKRRLQREKALKGRSAVRFKALMSFRLALIAWIGPGCTIPQTVLMRQQMCCASSAHSAHYLNKDTLWRPARDVLHVHQMLVKTSGIELDLVIKFPEKIPKCERPKIGLPLFK